MDPNSLSYKRMQIGPTSYLYNINMSKLLNNTTENIKLYKQKIEDANKNGSDNEKVKSLNEIKAKLFEDSNALKLTSDNSINVLKKEIDKLKLEYEKDGNNDKLEKVKVLEKIASDVEEVKNSDKYNGVLIDCSRTIKEVKRSIGKATKQKTIHELFNEIKEDIKYYDDQILMLERIKSKSERTLNLNNLKKELINSQNDDIEKRIVSIPGWEREISKYGTISGIKEDYNDLTDRLNKSITNSEQLEKPDLINNLKIEVQTNSSEICTSLKRHGIASLRHTF